MVDTIKNLTVDDSGHGDPPPKKPPLREKVPVETDVVEVPKQEDK